MIDLDEMAEEQDRMLRELAELGMDFARDLKAQVKAIKSVPEADALALAFYRVSRGVRLTLALRSKLVREHLEIGKLQRTADQRATERRKAQIKAVLEDEIFTEDRDQDEADALQERLSERLDTEALFERFLNGPVDRAIIRIRKDIGLPDEGAASLTSPVAAAMAGGGEERGLAEGKADAIDNDLSIAVTNARALARAGPAEHSEEPGVEGASHTHGRTLAPSTTPSAGRGPPPAAKAGEVRKKPGPS